MAGWNWLRHLIYGPEERAVAFVNPRYARLEIVAIEQEAAMRRIDQAVEDERRAAQTRALYQRYRRFVDLGGWETTAAATTATVTVPRQNPSIERARDLFITFLDPTQRRYFEAGLPIVHDGKAGRYILGGRANLIEAWLLDTTKHGPPGRYLMCVGPAGPLPQPDVFLTQLLWLRHDEERLLQTANVAQHLG